MPEQATPSPFKPQPFKLDIRNTRNLDAAHAHILLFGKTKAGKTSTSVTLESDPTRNAIISTQPEEQLAHLKRLNIPYVAVTNSIELDAALANPASLFPSMSTLIVDDFTEGVEFKRSQFDRELKDGRAVYKAVSGWASETLRRLLAGNFNLIMTCFERSLTDEASSVAWIGPDLPPSTAETVMSKFDFILYIDKEYKLLTRRDNTRRIIAGTRANAAFKELEEANLAKLWAKYQVAIK